MPLASGTYRDPIPLVQFLSSNGDGTGTSNGNGDYSVTPLTLYTQPPADEVYFIRKLVVHIADKGQFSQDGYGALSARTNGVAVNYANAGGTISDIVGGDPIKSNDDWFHAGFAGQLVGYQGTDNTLVIPIDFVALMDGQGLRVDGSQGQKLEVVLSDSFAGLDDHHFIAHGYR